MQKRYAHGREIVSKSEKELVRKCQRVGDINDVRAVVKEALRMGIGSEKQGPKVYKGVFRFKDAGGGVSKEYTKWYTRKHAAKNRAHGVATYATIEIDEE